MEVYRLLDQLAAPQRLRIAELQQNSLGEWVLQFAGGDTQFIVRLGSEQLSKRMSRFVSAYRKFFGTMPGNCSTSTRVMRTVWQYVLLKNQSQRCWR